MRFPIQRASMDEIKQACKELEERGFKIVCPPKKVSREGTYLRTVNYRAMVEK